MGLDDCSYVGMRLGSLKGWNRHKKKISRKGSQTIVAIGRYCDMLSLWERYYSNVIVHVA
jgi:hypothetical protein